MRPRPASLQNDVAELIYIAVVSREGTTEARPLSPVYESWEPTSQKSNTQWCNTRTFRKTAAPTATAEPVHAKGQTDGRFLARALPSRNLFTRSSTVSRPIYTLVYL